MSKQINMAVQLGLVVGILCSAWAMGMEPSQAYVKKDTWAQTLLATRANCIQGLSGATVELGPWYTSGPLKAKNFSDSLFPEKSVDLKARGADGKPLWTQVVYPDGKVHTLQAPNSHSTYFFRTIRSPEAQTIRVGLGSDDGIEVWLNGRKVHSKDVPRGAGADQDRINLDLKAGENALLLKIYNITGGHGFYFAHKDDPLAIVWDRLQQDFPREASWTREDVPGGVYLNCLKKSDPKVAQAMVQRVLGDLGQFAGRYQDKLTAAGANEKALLDLYVQACRFREGLESLKNIDLRALRMAIEDLNATFGERYAKGGEYLARLEKMERAMESGESLTDLAEEALALQRDALLANPLLDFDRILLVRREGPKLGLPQNWQGNCSLPRSGYDDDVVLLDYKGDGGMETVYKPEQPKMIADVDLHFDGEKMLFSAIGSHNRWQIWEVGTDGAGLRQITGKEPDVDDYDACYLPDERIIFASTRCFQGVPCVGGGDQVANLCVMNPDGSGIRRLCFDQDHNWCPTVMNNGRVMYTRWEYSDTSHYFTRIMFTMNPDGTNQMAYYGSNSYWPNSMFYARPIPDDPVKFAAIVSGHHGVARMGELHIFDPAKGRFEADGVVQQIPGHGKPVEARIEDQLVNASWPKFLHPYPLSEKYFLVSCQPTSSSKWGVYLVDAFDNMLLLREEAGKALFEPLPFRSRKRPPVIPDKVDLSRDDAIVYLSDIYFGDGLKGVPRGTVKDLRLFAFHYGYPQMGGHKHVAIEGGWDVHRILGTVPVEKDGSAIFRVPANTPIAIQPLDENGQAVQVMRSWFTAMPGETLSCVGCHEQQNTTAPPRYTLAARKAPSDIEPWYGPARGFSFKTEIQPVLDKYCVGCHNADAKGLPDFTAKDRNGWGNFTPSYIALHPFVRRPGPESDYHLEKPMEYHAGTSELVQMLRKGHHGVNLDEEAWDRLYTWIDLNVPDHGTWSEHRNIASNFEQRRKEMQDAYAFLEDDEPEVVPVKYTEKEEFVMPKPRLLPVSNVSLMNWPFDREHARMRQLGLGERTARTIDLGDGVSLKMVLIPAGEFAMGSRDYPDESPRHAVRIEEPFWMGVCEVTNAQFKRFDPEHFNGYINQQHKDHTTPGYPIDDPGHPAVRLSWRKALSFCEWLSDRTGQKFALPSEAQWEWACRAGTDTPMYYGDKDTDFARHANLADLSIKLLAVTGVNPQPIKNPSQYEDWLPKDGRFDDGQRIMTLVGQYEPNVWGLYDMHGNVWEWTRSAYRPYPYKAGDGREVLASDEKRVVRGGSWHDRPYRASSSFRLPYEPWQQVFNVGFRVVCEADTAGYNVALSKE